MRKAWWLLGLWACSGERGCIERVTTCQNDGWASNRDGSVFYVYSDREENNIVFNSVQAAVDAAGAVGGGTVLIEAGTYEETLMLHDVHSDVAIVGRCRDGVILNGSQDGDIVATVSVEEATVEISNLTIQGGVVGGIHVDKGSQVLLSQVSFRENDFVGIHVEGEGSQVIADQVEVYETKPFEEEFGFGVVVLGGAFMDFKNGLITRNSCYGVVVHGEETGMLLVRTEVSETRVPKCVEPDEEVKGGGVLVEAAEVVISDSEITDNEYVGVVSRVNSKLSVYGSSISKTAGDVYSGGVGLIVALDSVTAIEDTVIEDNAYSGVQVSQGGHVELVDSVVSNNHYLGVIVNGESTEILVLDTKISRNYKDSIFDEVYGNAGVLVEAQAHAEILSSILEENMHFGVVVDNATLIFEESEITGVFHDGREDLMGAALYIKNASDVVVDSALFSDNEGVGMFVKDAGTRVEMNGSTLLNPGILNESEGHGIDIQYGASLYASDSRIEGYRSVGVFLIDSGSYAELMNVDVIGVVPDKSGLFGRGVNVQCGAHLKANNLMIRENHDVGLFVSGADDVGDCSFSRVELENTTIKDTKMLGDGSGGSGVMVRDSYFSFVNGKIENNYSYGMLGLGDGTDLSLENVAITKTQRGGFYTVGTGLVTQSGAHLVGDDVEISETEGPGALLSSASMVLRDSVVKDNLVAGLFVSSGVANVVASEVTGNGSDVNEGMGVGVFVKGGRSGETALTLDGVLVSENPYASLWLSGPGTYDITDSTLSGGAPYELAPGVTLHGNAVYATGGVTERAEDGSGLWLSGNDFSGSEGVDVLLHGASASFAGDNTWSDSGPQLVQQRCDDIEQTPPDGYEEAPSASICPSPEHLVEDFDFDIEFSIPEIVDPY